MYILDTNTISELRKAGDGNADIHVVNWLNQNDISMFHLSVITLMELEIGTLRMERRDTKQGARLRIWLEQFVIPKFAGRILPINDSIALRCAKLHVPDPRSERDALIAATALTHDMTVVTRNIKDFKNTGIRLLNPWQV